MGHADKSGGWKSPVETVVKKELMACAPATGRKGLLPLQCRCQVLQDSNSDPISLIPFFFKEKYIYLKNLSIA